MTSSQQQKRESILGLRSHCELLFDSQHIVDSVQNAVLPLDIILQPKDPLSRTRIDSNTRRNCRLLARDDRQATLQLRPCLSKEFYRLLPGKGVRGHET